jgi:hypothetical protein
MSGKSVKIREIRPNPYLPPDITKAFIAKVSFTIYF